MLEEEKGDQWGWREGVNRVGRVPEAGRGPTHRAVCGRALSRVELLEG